MKNIEATKIAEALRSADIWDMGLAREMCEMAGMAEAFDAADGETFESVIYAAADKLGGIEAQSILARKAAVLMDGGCQATMIIILT